MRIPQKGDAVVRTADGARSTIAEVIAAGGENLYRLESGEEISEASFVKEHEEEGDLRSGRVSGPLLIVDLSLRKA